MPYLALFGIAFLTLPATANLTIKYGQQYAGGKTVEIVACPKGFTKYWIDIEDEGARVCADDQIGAHKVPRGTRASA